MPKGMKIIAVLQTLTALGLILFWVGFFTIGLAPRTPPPGYFVYEHSFPLPDLILAFSLLVAARMLQQGRPAGKTIAIACSGALMFLGVLDFSFNLLNGMYVISPMDLALNAFINLWCVVFGFWTAVELRHQEIQ